MAKTHSLGRLYVTRMRYLTRKEMPLLERGWTTEIDHPWRRGKSVVIRLPFSVQGLVVGVWTTVGDEDTNLYAAIEAREGWFHDVDFVAEVDLCA